MVALYTCRRCGEIKPTSDFNAADHIKRGHQGICRPCNALKCKAYANANRGDINKSARDRHKLLGDSVKIYQHEQYLKHKEKRLRYAVEKYASNKDAELIRLRDRYAADKDKYRTKAAEAYVKNPEAQRERKRDSYQKHKSKICAYVKNWAKKNPEKVTSYASSRRARKVNAVPIWSDELDDLFALEAADKANQLAVITGAKWEIDHMVPLKSKLVCGLHWHGNLQLLPAHVNRSKSNRVWPDMPEGVN